MKKLFGKELITNDYRNIVIKSGQRLIIDFYSTSENGKAGQEFVGGIYLLPE